MTPPAASGAGAVALANGASLARLSGGRVHLQHGPIDLVVRVDGARTAVDDACGALAGAFPSWLGALVDELSRLRRAETPGEPLPRGPIARRMVAAVRAASTGFVTPMAAVAGAVADEAVAVLSARPGIERAYVNNGGDIALHLTPGRALQVGVVASLAAPAPAARITVDHASCVRGVATSGWQGRSHSLGIADAVTVLAPSAALADAAATLVANAVDVDGPGIEREPASALDEDSDLGDRPVTTGVPALDERAVEAALDAGLACARSLRARGVVAGAALSLQGRWRVLGEIALGGAAGVGR